MSIDRRGYRFSLAPLLAQARWQLDAARDALGRAVRQTHEARDQVSKALAFLKSESARVDGASQDDTQWLDVGRRMASMAYLSKLHGSLEQAKAEVRRCESIEAEARHVCVQAQRDVERFEQVEARQWEQFVQDRAAAEARESDADWLARTLHLRDTVKGLHSGGSHD